MTTYKTDENKMPYIYVLELSRYRRLNIAAKFFECIFVSFESIYWEIQKNKIQSKIIIIFFRGIMKKVFWGTIKIYRRFYPLGCKSN